MTLATMSTCLGMKFTDFEGGTRVASWVSGGVVPAARRGTVHSAGLAHIADWCAFAGRGRCRSAPVLACVTVN